jgi:hypothetical protein
MPATEVDSKDYRPFFLCKPQFLQEIVSMSLGRNTIPRKARGAGAMVSVAPASRRLLADSLISNTVATIRHISAKEMNSGAAR